MSLRQQFVRPRMHEQIVKAPHRLSKLKPIHTKSPECIRAKFNVLDIMFVPHKYECGIEKEGTSSNMAYCTCTATIVPAGSLTCVLSLQPWTSDLTFMLCVWCVLWVTVQVISGQFIRKKWVVHLLITYWNIVWHGLTISLSFSLPSQTHKLSLMKGY